LIVMQMVSSLNATSSLLAPALASETPSLVQVAFVSSPVPDAVTEAPTLAVTATGVAMQVSSPTDTGIPVNTSTPQATLPAGLASCIPQNTPRETGLVVDVIDGDTIDVRIGDQILRVRYIGINTPEQDEPLYHEALAYNQALVMNQTVTLVRDTSETDSYARLLRYVITADIFVNQALVEMGYAEAAAYAPDTTCVSAFEAAQSQAQTANVGLWLSTPVAFIAPVTGGDAAANCDPSYPGVCIPPAPPDLDCGDVPHDRFQVVPPDPHGFDRDGDGVGCE
jgi:micrococcal nuclease